MKIDRATLVSQLEMVSPGLSARDIIEQSQCYVFTDGHVITYNDEIACSHPTDTDIEGAVVSSELLKLLHNIHKDELTLRVEKGELHILRKGGRSKIRMEEQILLPYDSVEKPKRWKPLPKDFLEAIRVARTCTSKDQSQFALTCLLFTKQYIDGCDRFQACRYTIDLPIKRSFLIRRESIGYIATMEVSEMSETKDWVHFRNDSGLVLSCRRYANVDDFLSIDDIIRKEGKKLVLPKGLRRSIQNGRIFAESDPGSDCRVQVTLKADKMYVEGSGINGTNTEVVKTKYKGPSFTFEISADLFIEFGDKFSNCHVSDRKLYVKANKLAYTTSIGKPKK